MISSTDTTVVAPSIQPSPTNPEETYEIKGALPDGTEYTIRGEALDPSVQGAGAAIVIDLPNGDSPVIGITTFLPGEGGPQTGYENGQLFVPAGEWTVKIEIYDHIQTLLGADIEETLSSSIQGRATNGHPVLHLIPPFRFAADDEVPLQMDVMYESFVVMRGCSDELWAICSSTGAVQAVPLSEVTSGHDAIIFPDPLWIDSPAPRPSDNPYFLDKGPLAVRGDHTVLWTGTEMLVWGGASGDEYEFLVDGAAFDPVTSSWRLLPTAPLEPQRTVAAWTGEELMVVGSDQAASYSDVTGWKSVPPPIFDGEPTGLAIEQGAISIWDGEQVLIWSGKQMVGFDPISETWTRLAAPPMRATLRTLTTEGELMVAVGFRQQTCFPLEAYLLAGDSWEPLPEVDVGTPTNRGCVIPQTTALIGGRMFVWDTAANETRTMSLDFAIKSWTQIETIPLRSCESFPRPLITGDGVLVFDYCDRYAATLDPTTGSWTLAQPPGRVGNGDTVWTGTEVLMWGDSCCYGTNSLLSRLDAWRWRPPDTNIVHNLNDRVVRFKLPDGWQLASESLTPNLGDPREVLSAGTYSLTAGGSRCAQVPQAALERLGADDVLVTLFERSMFDDTMAQRPVSFETGIEGIAQGDVLECVDPQEVDDIGVLVWLPFRDQGRSFYLLTVMGTDVDETVRRQTLELLDSLTFEPAPNQS